MDHASFHNLWIIVTANRAFVRVLLFLCQKQVEIYFVIGNLISVTNEEVVEIWEDLQYDKRRQEGVAKMNHIIRNKRYYYVISTTMGEGKERKV